MLRRQRATTHEDITRDAARIAAMNVFTVFPTGDINATTLTNWLHVSDDMWIHKHSKTIMHIFAERHYVTMHLNRKPSAAACRNKYAEIRHRARLRRIMTMTRAMSHAIPGEIMGITAAYV